MNLILKEEKLPTIKSFPALFVGSCRTGKSFRMRELAKDKEVIYILTNAHKMEDDSFKLCGSFNEGDVFKTNVFSNSSKLLEGEHGLISIADYVLFAIENDIYLFLDESDRENKIKNRFLSVLSLLNYSKVVVSTQSFQDIMEQTLIKNYFKTLFLGRINDVSSAQEVLKIIKIPFDKYRALPTYSFVMVEND